MGDHLNRLDEPIFKAVPKAMLTEFGIHYRLESYDDLSSEWILFFVFFPAASCSRTFTGLFELKHHPSRALNLAL